MSGETIPAVEVHRNLARHHASEAARRVDAGDFDPSVIECGKTLEAAYRHLVLHMVRSYDLQSDNNFLARADEILTGKHHWGLEDRIERSYFYQCVELLQKAFGDRIDEYGSLLERPLHSGGPALGDLLDAEADSDVVQKARNLAAHSTRGRDDPLVPHETQQETAIAAFEHALEVLENIGLVSEQEARRLSDLEPVVPLEHQAGEPEDTAWASDTPDVSDVATMEDFADHLERFVLEEQAANRVLTAWKWDKPLEDRVEEGYAVGGLRVEAIEKDSIGNIRRIRLSCRRNLSRIREGETVLLSRDEPQEGCPCTLVKDEELELTVEQNRFHDPKFQFLDLEEGEEGLTLDKDLFENPTRERVVENLRRSTPKALRTFEVLTGKRLPHEEEDLAAVVADAIQRLQEEIDLDPIQIEAVASGCKKKPYSIVRGPPGTGKTRVLAATAAALAAEGQRVLLSGFTNRAVDNGLAEVLEIGLDNVPAFKVAREQRWPSNEVPAYEYIKEAFRSDVPREGGFVAGATAFTVGGSRLRGPEGSAIPFDQVVVDEASQLDIVLGSHILMAADSVMLVGDENQTSPILQAKHSPDWLEESVFSILRKYDEGVLLSNTYRLNDELADFPSKTFYEGRIQAAEGVGERRLGLEIEPAPPYDKVLDPGSPFVTCQIPHEGCRSRSRPEAEHVAKIVGEAVEAGVPAESILVLTPFRAQERLLRQLLSEEAKDRKEWSLHAVPVDTVERAQGREFEMTVFSLATSSPEYAESTAEFLFDPRRFNVATTRARSKCIMLVSPSLLGARIDPGVHPGFGILQRFVNETPGLTLERSPPAPTVR